MGITQIDHVEEGLGRLPHQWGKAVNLRGLLASWLTPLNKLEQDAIDVRDGFNVFTAVGKQLDMLGAIYNVTRRGYTDEEFRGLILAGIVSSSGSGTPDQLITLYASIAGAESVQYWEHYPLSIALLANQGAEVNYRDIEVMQAASGAAIEYSALMYNPQDYAWIGSESVQIESFIEVDTGDLLVTGTGANLVINTNVEEVELGGYRSSFIDISQDEDPLGYGEEYGVAYGGRVAGRSEFCEASLAGNTEFVIGGNGYIPWAETNELDPVTGTTNKYQPIPQIEATGLKPKQPLPRQFFNWMMASIDGWLSHFGDRVEVGAVRFMVNVSNTATEEARFDTRLGGTWSYEGENTTISSETLYVFKRTS